MGGMGGYSPTEGGNGGSGGGPGGPGPSPAAPAELPEGLSGWRMPRSAAAASYSFSCLGMMTIPNLARGSTRMWSDLGLGLLAGRSG
mmetsp:Transcript_27673/g.60167  ORF Transcript_27673/g.60167 Transcript_27673/m.60167 type:complete len:87 (+) Transcript_27673:71-331(+)